MFSVTFPDSSGYFYQPTSAPVNFSRSILGIEDQSSANTGKSCTDGLGHKAMLHMHTMHALCTISAWPGFSTDCMALNTLYLSHMGSIFGHRKIFIDSLESLIVYYSGL